MRLKAGLALLLVVAGATAFTYSAREGSSKAAPLYLPARPVRTYPSSYAKIQGWINADDTASIRQHAWDIWESITAKGPAGQPTWQTWASGHEVFEMTTGETKAKARSRHGQLNVEIRPLPGHRLAPRRAGVADTLPVNLAERTFAFNRFSQSAAQFIYRNRLNSGNMLWDTLAAMVRNNVPVASREVLASPDSTDASQFVLKAVYQFISGTQLTAVPVWTGDDTSATYTPLNPVPSRWRRGIAVDPTGKYKLGDSVIMVLNNEPPQKMPVVPLSAFYYKRITIADSVNFSTFGPINGDFIGVANDTSAQAVYMAMRPGNIGLLMAMHVTGKETPNWTWQSYWWALNPQDRQYGADRPKTIPAPWNHYNLTVTYSMTDTKGVPIIGFNPYLETSLEGKIPNGPGPSPDSTSWTGVTSNCMSCHRRASIGYASTSGGIAITGAPYGPAAFVSAADTVIFTQPVAGLPARVPLLKTDFLWSVAIRASAPTVVPVKRK